MFEAYLSVNPTSRKQHLGRTPFDGFQLDECKVRTCATIPFSRLLGPCTSLNVSIPIAGGGGGYTLKLQPTSPKMCTCNKDQVIY